ncbi:CU044_5270 family protein [Micromonospora sp. NPDC048999]|uniref:CU044_5270 family protein n=1 Tax=Micromonospora sp. NPDC048999 TaxID=3155391 RepID=UPI0033F7B8F2
MNTAPNQPYSNERDELARLLPEPVEMDLPSGRQRQLQEFVMSQIHQDRRAAEQARRHVPKRRLVFATSALAAVAVAAVAIGTGGFGGRGTDGSTGFGGRGTDGSTGFGGRGTDGSTGFGGRGTDGPAATELSPVAHTLELAADYAAARPFTPPRPDQWIYIENRNTASSALAKDKGQKPAVTERTWLRADGKKMGDINVETGKLDTWDQANGYPTLSTLPTDPQEVLNLLRESLAPPSSAPGGRQLPFAFAPKTPDELDGLLFFKIAKTLADYLLPPDVTATLWRAAALVPGVTQAPGTVDVGGRRVIAVGRIQDGWRFEQLLLDPDTHEFVGYRSVAVKDFTFTTGPNGRITEKKGRVQYTITRLAAKIVDAAGQTN